MKIDSLYLLVHSLSKSELRYVRLMAGRQAGDKGFVRLFDCLLKHDALDEFLWTELTQTFPDATLEPARKYLYRVIMQCLRQFEQTKRIDVRIGQLLHDSQLLYERGLVQASQDQLTKARNLAEQYERGIYALLATRQQLEQWVRWQFDGIDEATLARQHGLIRQQMERTQAALHHAALYESLLLRYHNQGLVRSSSDRLRLNDLLLEEHQLLSRERQQSFSVQQQHLHFQSAYFRMVGDGASSLRVYRELDALFQKNHALWSEQPLYYVQLLEGILADLRLLKQYDQMPYFIERFQTINTTLQGQALAQTTPFLVLYYSLLRAIDQGHYADAAQMLPDDTQRFDRQLAQLPLPTRTEFDLLLVRLDIGRNQLSAALQRLNKILVLSARSLPQTLATQRELLNLLLHARLGSADYLGYALRARERKNKSSGQRPASEQLIIDLLRQWLNGQLTSASLTRIDAFSGSPADEQLLRNLDLRTWVLQMLAS